MGRSPAESEPGAPLAFFLILGLASLVTPQDVTANPFLDHPLLTPVPPFLSPLQQSCLIFCEDEQDSDFLLFDLTGLGGP